MEDRRNDGGEREELSGRKRLRKLEALQDYASGRGSNALTTLADVEGATVDLSELCSDVDWPTGHGRIGLRPPLVCIYIQQRCSSWYIQGQFAL